jgi:hypothetical protein
MAPAFPFALAATVARAQPANLSARLFHFFTRSFFVFFFLKHNLIHNHTVHHFRQCVRSSTQRIKATDLLALQRNLIVA